LDSDWEGLVKAASRSLQTLPGWGVHSEVVSQGPPAGRTTRGVKVGGQLGDQQVETRNPRFRQGLADERLAA
jgi:hypothetical protein